MTDRYSSQPNSCYAVYAKRTPFGKILGQLKNIRPDDLLSFLLDDFKNQFIPSQDGFKLHHLDDFIVGCANQAGEDNRNIARMSLLLSEFPTEVPGTTINRLCGSSLDAAQMAYALISSGMKDAVLVGGVESMSRAPYVLSKAETAFDRQQKCYDSTFGWRFINPKMSKVKPPLSMGETAEEVAARFKISRVEQDHYALRSHQLCAKFKSMRIKEICPIKLEINREEFLMDDDECIRADSQIEKLQKLKPVFNPQGTVTAGNSSPMNDGAALLLFVSGEYLKKFHLTPMFKVEDAAVVGLDPDIMGMGPVGAIKKILHRQNKKISDYDSFEINEAFAAQVLAVQKELNIPSEKLNPQGGALAIGHPLGASGARLLVTLAHQMQNRPEMQAAIASMCIGVGQGIALSITRK